MGRIGLTALAAVCTAVPVNAQTAERTITFAALLRMPTFGNYELSPNGRRVLCTRSERDTVEYNATSHIYLHDIATGQTVQLTNSAKGESRPIWLRDGRSNANVNDWGGKDYTDIMNGVDHVIALGVADPARMGIMGGSYGGFMTFWAVTQTNRFQAAIGHAGISDWYSFHGQTDIPNLLEFGFGGMPTQSKETYERWSPVEYATGVATPLLITHGENDRRVPISQAEQYFRSLKKLEKTVEFLRYSREGHGIAEPLHRLHLDREQEKWFARYVLGAGPVM